jgi:hypothetical protein
MKMKIVALKAIVLLLFSVFSTQAEEQNIRALAFFTEIEKEYKSSELHKSFLNDKENPIQWTISGSELSRTSTTDQEEPLEQSEFLKLIRNVVGKQYLSPDNLARSCLLKSSVAEVINYSGLTDCTYMKFLVLSDLMSSLTRQGYFDAAECIFLMICNCVNSAHIIPVSTTESSDRYMTIGIIAATILSDQKVNESLQKNPQTKRILGKTIEQARVFKEFDFVEQDHKIDVTEIKIERANIADTVENYMKTFPYSSVKNMMEARNDLACRKGNVERKIEEQQKRVSSTELYRLWHTEKRRLRDNMFSNFNEIKLSQLIGIDYNSDSDGITSSSGNVINATYLQNNRSRELSDKQFGQRWTTATISRNTPQIINNLMDDKKSILPDSIEMRAIATCFRNNLAIVDPYMWAECPNFSKTRHQFNTNFSTYNVFDRTYSGITIPKEGIFISNPFCPIVVMSHIEQQKYLRVYTSWEEFEKTFDSKDHDKYFEKVLLREVLKNVDPRIEKAITDVVQGKEKQRTLGIFSKINSDKLRKKMVNAQNSINTEPQPETITNFLESYFRCASS